MLIKLEDVSYVYSEKTAYEQRALDHVDLEIPQGQFLAIIGHTGSGKSTLIQHFNGLMKPTSGKVLCAGQDIWADGYNRRDLRFKVGLVFQYPEHQLFEVDVLTDVCFGPKNQGLSDEEAKKKAYRSLEHCGVPEELFGKSPFELSGGQKRRAAIAGVLAMDPEVLILDEPTAGLDPKGREEIFRQIDSLREKRDLTIILVSHSMEDVAKYADRLIVMNHGRKAYDGSPKEVFAHYKELEEIGLAAPQITYVMHDLQAAGLDVPTDILNVEEARDAILAALKKDANRARKVRMSKKGNATTEKTSVLGKDKETKSSVAEKHIHLADEEAGKEMKNRIAKENGETKAEQAAGKA